MKVNNKGLWLLVAAAAMLTMLPGISCGDDNDNNPTDDGGVDTRDDSGGDTAEQCPPTSFPAGTSEMRLRHLKLTAPTAMATSPILQQLVDNSMDAEDFIWLLTFDGIGSGTISLRTGSGAKVAGTTCTYGFLDDPEFLPDSMTMSETGLEFVLSGDPIAALNVPMWSEGTAYPDPPLLTLPLRELDISGTFNADHLGFGSYSDSSGLWTDGGLLVGKVTAADAQATVIDLLGMTLCGLVSGSTGVAGNPADDCQGDPTTWPRPPDAMVGTDPAYNMSGTISATAVHVQP
jgi:hypothetical protein